MCFVFFPVRNRGRSFASTSRRWVATTRQADNSPRSPRCNMNPCDLKTNRIIEGMDHGIGTYEIQEASRLLAQKTLH